MIDISETRPKLQTHGVMRFAYYTLRTIYELSNTQFNSPTQT